MRITLDDRMNGDMTLVDFPGSFPFDLTNGQAKLKTSMNALLNSIDQPGLAPCTSVEIVSVAVCRRELQPVRSGWTLSPDAVSAPGAIRTHDPRIRNPVLYPPELRGRSCEISDLAQSARYRQNVWIGEPSVTSFPNGRSYRTFV